MSPPTDSLQHGAWRPQHTEAYWHLSRWREDMLCSLMWTTACTAGLWSGVSLINAWWKISSGGPNFDEAMRQPRHEIKNQEGLGCWTIHYRQDEYCVIKDGHFFDSSSSKNSGQITKHSLHDVTDLKHGFLLAVKTEVILGQQTDTDTVTVSLQH